MGSDYDKYKDMSLNDMSSQMEPEEMLVLPSFPIDMTMKRIKSVNTGYKGLGKAFMFNLGPPVPEMEDDAAEEIFART